MERNLQWTLWFTVYRGTMKLALATLIILFGAALAAAQKPDPILARSHPTKPAKARSFGPDGVKAALGTKSTTASDLAKIEHGTAKPPNASKPATVHTNVAKNFGLVQENKNKPMRTSNPSGAGHPAVHQKPKTR